jgi:hypothetical protein
MTRILGFSAANAEALNNSVSNAAKRTTVFESNFSIFASFFLMQVAFLKISNKYK